MSPSSFDEPQFLEPAHHHDPTKISNVANIPAALLEDLAVDAQKALLNIQESASVAYASYRRLRDLSKERFHRLVPAKKQDHDVEAIQCESDQCAFALVFDILTVYPICYGMLTHLQTPSQLFRTTSTPFKRKRLTSWKKQLSTSVTRL